MAAGLGFKDFVTGEVLTAADVDGYLMQGVWVFASAAARDAAVTSPQEGNFAYLKDTNVTTYYTGSAWANLDTTGMTNPMTTTGDTIYSSSGSTPARLGIGSTGQVLTVASGIPSWATSSSGGMTLLSTTALSGASTYTISSISGSYNDLYLYGEGITGTGGDVQLRVNGITTSSYAYSGMGNDNGGIGSSQTYARPLQLQSTTLIGSFWSVIPRYASSTNLKIISSQGMGTATTIASWANYSNNCAIAQGAITSITIFASANFTGGNLYIYGVK